MRRQSSTDTLCALTTGPRGCGAKNLVFILARSAGFFRNKSVGALHTEVPKCTLLFARKFKSEIPVSFSFHRG